MKEKLKSIEILLLDVDGVLTDAGIIYTDSGEQIKRFNAKDGLGIRLLMDNGIKTGIITGLSSKALHHRCEKLGISILYDNVKNKAAAIEDISIKTGIKYANMAFAGDDIIDLPAIKKVGVSFCVADANETIKEHCDFVTTLNGGYGAVREICEMILKAKGLWEGILETYLTRC